MAPSSGDRLSAAPTILLEDRFTVASCDDSKFEKVTRVRGRSAAFDADITLDVNTHVYPIKKKEVLNFAFAMPGNSAISPELQSLLDDYEYVCHGRIFNEDEKQDRRSVYLSFGGLLCGITAEKAILSEFVIDNRIFLFVSRSKKL